MPNIKASVRSVKTDAKRRLKNAAEKTRAKLAGKKVIAAVKNGNMEEASECLRLAAKAIDQAAANNVIHKNAAARKKSRLARMVNTIKK